jgi:hypothetical protein
MAHSHWEGGPVCRFRTKKECDEFLRWDAHFHPGVPCDMGLEPGWKPKRRADGTMSKQMETCRLEPIRKAEYMKALGVPREARDFCLACEYGGPHHGGPGCKRAAGAVERGVR